MFAARVIGKPAPPLNDPANLHHDCTSEEARVTADLEQSPVEKHILDFTGKPNKKLAKIITKAANKYRVDPLLLSTIIEIESAFNHKMQGSRGERGLAQIMPRGVCSQGQNLRTETGQANAGAHCLRMCFDRCETLDRALTMYACGKCRSRSKRTQKRIKYRVKLYRKNQQKFGEK
jgi:hypothetical protein